MAFPLDENTLVNYLAANDKWRADYVRSITSAVVTHQRAHFGPWTTCGLLKSYVSAVRRAGPERAPLIDPVRLGDLEAMVATIGLDRPPSTNVIRARALLALAWLTRTSPWLTNSTRGPGRGPSSARREDFEQYLGHLHVRFGDQKYSLGKAAPGTLAGRIAEALALEPSEVPEPFIGAHRTHTLIQDHARRAGWPTAWLESGHLHGLAEVEVSWFLVSLDYRARTAARDKAYLSVGVWLARRHQDMNEISLSDVTALVENYRLYQRTSKTGADALKWLPHAVEGRPCTTSEPCATACPVRALEDYLALDRYGYGRTSGPLFTGNARKDGLSRSRGMGIVKDAWGAAGLPPAHLGTRSLRAGGATSASEAGATLAEVADLTDHVSLAMAARYIRRHHPNGHHIALNPFA